MRGLNKRLPLKAPRTLQWLSLYLSCCRPEPHYQRCREACIRSRCFGVRRLSFTPEVSHALASPGPMVAGLACHAGPGPPSSRSAPSSWPSTMQEHSRAHLPSNLTTVMLTSGTPGHHVPATAICPCASCLASGSIPAHALDSLVTVSYLDVGLSRVPILSQYCEMKSRCQLPCTGSYVLGHGLVGRCYIDAPARDSLELGPAQSLHPGGGQSLSFHWESLGIAGHWHLHFVQGP